MKKETVDDVLNRINSAYEKAQAEEDWVKCDMIKEDEQVFLHSLLKKPTRKLPPL